MKTDVTIEWLVEEIDQHGDIIEVHHLDSYVEARACAALVDENLKTDIGLVRDRGNDLEGLIDRQWAYVENGKLPVRFSYGGGAEGPLVPTRYHNELERY